MLEKTTEEQHQLQSLGGEWGPGEKERPQNGLLSCPQHTISINERTEL